MPVIPVHARGDEADLQVRLWRYECMTKRTKKVAVLAVAICALSASVSFAATTNAGSVAVGNTSVNAPSMDEVAIDALRSEVDPSVFIAASDLNELQNSLSLDNLVALNMLDQESIDQVVALSQLLSKKTNTDDGVLVGITQPETPAPADKSKVRIVAIDTSDDTVDGASLRNENGTVVYMPVLNPTIGSYKLVPVTTVSTDTGSSISGSITLDPSIVKLSPVKQGSDIVAVSNPVISQTGYAGGAVAASKNNVNPVPEPFTMALPLAGIAFLRTLRKRNK